MNAPDAAPLLDEEPSGPPPPVWRSPGPSTRAVTRRSVLARLALAAAASPSLAWTRGIAARSGPVGSAAGPDGLRSDQDGRATIFLAPDDHTDYFWSADDEVYAREFVATLDYYLDLIDRTVDEGRPDGQQARWNCDGWLWVRAYERAKDASAFDRLVARIRDGHIGVPLNALALVQGGAPLEAIVRGMTYPGRLERRFDLRLPLVIAMENATLPYGLASVWAGCGARFSWKGICGCASRVSRPTDRPHDIYWWVGPDGQRLLMKWHRMFGGNDGPGGYAEMRYVTPAVEFVTPGSGDPGFRERYPFDVIGLFGQGWDDLATRSETAVEAARTLTDGRREVRLSNAVDFFEAFEARYGVGIPEHGAAYGNEWDVLVASLQETTARVRRAVERLRAAEALASVVVLAEPAAFSDLAADGAACHESLALYYEHDWTADGPVPRPVRAAWQVRLADTVDRYVENLHGRAATRLGASIGTSGPGALAAPASADAERWFVFNPLGWARRDVVDLTPSGGPRPVRVIDVASGAQRPCEWVTDPGRPDGQRLRVLMDDVPAVGYRVVAIVDSEDGEGDDGLGARVALDGDALVNDAFQVDVGPDGRIVRWIDRRRANRNVGPTGDAACNALVALDRTGVEAGRATRRTSAGRVSASFTADVERPRRHTTTLTLHAGLPRLDIESAIDEGFDEVLAWAFAFDVDDPVVWHEEIGAVIAARLAGDGGHYSPVAARYDWLTFQHFAAIGPRHGDGPWVVVANRDCSFFRLGDSTPDHLDTAAAHLYALAGGQVDGPTLGFPAQGGATHHRYGFALTTLDRFDAAAAMRFGLEATNPFVAGRVTSTTGGRPADTWSLLSVSDPDVLLWALKPAEDSGADRLSARLWNLAGRPATPLVRIGPPYALRGAVRTTHIETPIAPEGLRGGALPAELRVAEIGTWELAVGRPASSSGQVVWLPLAQNDG